MKRIYILVFLRVYKMILTKTKTTILLVLVSTTFILSIISYAISQQQAFGQGVFQTEQQSERNQSPPPLILEEANNDTGVAESTTTTTKDNQKIILGGITIPITPNTSISLELPDSKITVQPNK